MALGMEPKEHEVSVVLLSYTRCLILGPEMEATTVFGHMRAAGR